jgi:hypothetical protein
LRSSLLIGVCDEDQLRLEPGQRFTTARPTAEAPAKIALFVAG